MPSTLRSFSKIFLSFLYSIFRSSGLSPQSEDHHNVIFYLCSCTSFTVINCSVSERRRLKCFRGRNQRRYGGNDHGEPWRCPAGSNILLPCLTSWKRYIFAYLFLNLSPKMRSNLISFDLLASITQDRAGSCSFPHLVYGREVNFKK